MTAQRPHATSLTDGPTAAPQRRLLPTSLFGRSLLIVMVPIILLQAISAYVFYNRHWADVGRRLALGFASDVAVVIEALEEFGTGPEFYWLLEQVRENQQLSAMFQSNHQMAETPPHAPSGSVDKTLLRVLPERIPYPFYFDTQSEPTLVKVWIELPGGVLFASVPRKRLFSSTIHVFILWMVGTSVILLATAIYFLSRQVQPIRRLADAAESFGKGIQVVDFKPSGAREVRQAANAFLRMRERIQRQISQRTEMLAGVSHDLRTPLTRMKLQLAMLPDSDAVRDLKADAAEMQKMVDGYLAFARGEGTELPVAVKIADVVDEVVVGARRNGALVDVAGCDRATVTVRRNAVKRALTNLVENATRHGTHVRVGAEQQNGFVTISVDDDGPGIPVNQRESVFKPFYRLDASRNVETGGIGLGLSIARDVVRNHGGDLILGDSPMGGLRAALKLPI